MSGVAPRTDDELPAYWDAMALPGVVDVHTHFLPPRLMRRICEYFESAGPLIGMQWPINYKQDEEERVAALRSMGVRAFSALVYPHKPDMAESLNVCAREFAARTPECLQTATFFPEPQAAAYVEDAIQQGAQLFKAHIQVGAYDPRDSLLDGVWGLLADARIPVVVHAGSGPVPGEFTGPEPFTAVLNAHPQLAAIIAHLGLPDYDDFLALADEFPNVMFDTTMAFTDFSLRGQQPSKRLVDRLAELPDRLLFGSDFPNIPYAYAHQVEALHRLGLGDEWLRALFWDNAARLFTLTGP